MTVLDLYAVLPLVVLVSWATLLILADLFIPEERKEWTILLAALGLVVSLVILLTQVRSQPIAFNGMVVMDGFAVFLSALFLGSGLLGIALSYGYLKRMGIDRSEYYILMLFSVAGMMLMAMAADLIVVFLALELLSIPLYVLAGFARPRLDSEEAAERAEVEALGHADHVEHEAVRLACLG